MLKTMEQVYKNIINTLPRYDFTRNDSLQYQLVDQHLVSTSMYISTPN